MSETTDIPDSLKKAVADFRKIPRHKPEEGQYRVLAVQINKVTLAMEKDEDFEEIKSEAGITLEQVADTLPSHSPRYVLLSYETKRKDGRMWSPLLLINWVPSCSPNLTVLYTSAFLRFSELVGANNVIEMKGKDAEEEFTQENLDAQLQ